MNTQAAHAACLRLFTTLLLAVPAYTQQHVNVGSEPREFKSIGSIVFFHANDGISGRELWRSDGTTEGTFMLVDASPGNSEGPRDRLFYQWDGLLYSGTMAPDSQLWTWWMSDGSVDGTGPLLNLEGLATTSTLISNGPLQGGGAVKLVNREYLYHPGFAWSLFGRQGVEVFCSLSVGETTFVSGTTDRKPFAWKVSDSLTAPKDLGENLEPTETYFFNVGNKVFFPLKTPEYGRELYLHDLDTDSTTLVKDINPGPESGFLWSAVDLSFQGKLFFRADDGVHGPEPWISDGTYGGTLLLGDLNPGTAASQPNEFAAGNTQFYFQATNVQYGCELWVSDGTETGTRLLKDIWPGPGSGTPYRTASRGDELYFSAAHPQFGHELWYSNGSTDGTRIVSDHWPGETSSNAGYYKAFAGETLLVSAEDRDYGEEIWRVNDSNDGLELVKDITTPEPDSLNLAPSQLTASGTTLYFVINDAEHGAELWLTHDLAYEARLALDIWTGPVGSNPCELLDVNGTLFFQATAPSTGAELWRTDGTPEGTLLVADVNRGAQSSYPHELTYFRDRIYFAASVEQLGTLLYSVPVIRPEGTDGLRQEVEPSTSPSGYGPHDLTVFDDKLYFLMENVDSQKRLWVISDDSPATVHPFISQDHDSWN